MFFQMLLRISIDVTSKPRNVSSIILKYTMYESMLVKIISNEKLFLKIAITVEFHIIALQ